MIDSVTAELKKVKDISLICYVGERIENETIKDLYLSLVDINSEQEEELEEGKTEEHEEKEEQADVQQMFNQYVSKNYYCL